MFAVQKVCLKELRYKDAQFRELRKEDFAALKDIIRENILFSIDP